MRPLLAIDLPHISYRLQFVYNIGHAPAHITVGYDWAASSSKGSDLSKDKVSPTAYGHNAAIHYTRTELYTNGKREGSLFLCLNMYYVERTIMRLPCS